MAKKIRRLSDSDAIYLGLDLKPHDKGRNSARYFLTEAQFALIDEYRGISGDRQFVNVQKKLNKDGEVISTIEKLQAEPIDIPENFEIIKISTSKTTGQQWIQYSPKKENKEERFIKDIIATINSRKIEYPKIKYSEYSDPHMIVINPADVHIGKLAMEYETGDPHNNELIISRVKEGVLGLLKKSQGFNIEKILFVVGADILHIDNTKRQTTSGTPQDTDGMWFTNFLLAKELYIDVIETLIQIAPIHIHYDPSNHDYMSGFYLAQCIEAWFKNVKDITFDNSISHRKYTKYGKNIIGTTHGDGAKKNDLHRLMAEEASIYWHECRHRYFYTEHIHHKEAKDYGSVCVESFRSPSGTDSWHHRNAFQHSPKAIEAFIHHPEQGQIARITNIF